MYTFYFKALPSALAPSTRCKLVAIKGLRVPLAPKLGGEYDELMIRLLVRNGHRVVLIPSISAPEHPKDVLPPEMHYAPGYRGPYGEELAAALKTELAVRYKDLRCDPAQFVPDILSSKAVADGLATPPLVKFDVEPRRSSLSWWTRLTMRLRQWWYW